MSSEITPVAHKLSAAERHKHYGHAGAVLWLTGLSASGKSTLAMALEKELTGHGYSCYVLDGDNIRSGLNANLGFSPEERSENIRRVGEVAALFADAGLICISAFISPYRGDRERARAACKSAFREVHVHAALEVCESRDPKGLYRKARAGGLREFTGIDAPYEAPEVADLRIDTGSEPVTESLRKLVGYVLDEFPLSRIA